MRAWGVKKLRIAYKLAIAGLLFEIAEAVTMRGSMTLIGAGCVVASIILFWKGFKEYNLHNKELLLKDLEEKIAETKHRERLDVR